MQEGTAAGALGGTLPTPDASGTISMSATTGKVALVNADGRAWNDRLPAFRVPSSICLDTELA